MIHIILDWTVLFRGGPFPSLVLTTALAKLYSPPLTPFAVAIVACICISLLVSVSLQAANMPAAEAAAAAAASAYC